jgi:hypothetical protein
LFLQIGHIGRAEAELCARGYPVFPHKNKSVYRTVYWECAAEGLDFGHFCESALARRGSKSVGDTGVVTPPPVVE